MSTASSLKKSKSSGSKSKTQSKTKTSSSAAIDADTDARFEGTDPNWSYTPPAGATLVKEDSTADLDAGEFDWDKVNEDDDLELWVIRVPDAIKPKHLENITFSLPSSSSKKTTRVGNVKRKTTTFDIWSVADDNDDDANDDAEDGGEDNSKKGKKHGKESKDAAKKDSSAKENDEDAPVGGEELKGLACLLPRKSKKGKLYPAPKPFTRHLVISAQPIQPSSISTTTPTSTPMAGVPSTPLDLSQPYKNPERYSYPKEVLKHRYIPYGSTELLGTGGVIGGGGAVEAEEEGMDVDAEVEVEAPPSGQPQSSPKKSKKGVKEVKEKEVKEKVKETEKKGKGKKRKGDDVGGVADEGGVPAKKAKKSKE